MAFTEFCCRSGGSNMNGGALSTGAEPATTPVYSFTNGGWNSGTGVYTPTSGNPSLTVTVGDFAHVFTDGATTPVRIARVTTVSSTTITLSTSVGSGTAPGTVGSGISINVGGAWLGPNGAVTFPAAFMTAAAVNVAGNMQRINFKNDQTYNITAALAPTAYACIYQGYTTSFGDLGKATFDAGGTAIIIITFGFQTGGIDLIFQNNGSTNVNGVVAAGRSAYHRIIANNIGGSGFTSTGGAMFVECEAYACNKSSTSQKGGFSANSGSALNCYSHDNTGANTVGFDVQYTVNCIADSNGGRGFYLGSPNVQAAVINCDSYNNGGSGVYIAATNSVVMIRNSNLIKNTGYGIENNAGFSGGYLRVEGCGYGAGSMANTTADMLASAATTNTVEVGKVTYASGVTPWVDPANGDFTINLAAAKNAGWLKFLQTSPTAGATAYPDIGAAQHQDSGGASTAPVGDIKIFGRGAPY